MDERGLCFNVPAEMLEAYKVKIMDDIRNGTVPIDLDGSPSIRVPAELLLWLIGRAQAWERLEHDEVVHRGNER